MPIEPNIAIVIIIYKWSWLRTKNVPYSNLDFWLCFRWVSKSATSPDCVRRQQATGRPQKTGSLTVGTTTGRGRPQVEECWTTTGSRKTTSQITGSLHSSMLSTLITRSTTFSKLLKRVVSLLLRSCCCSNFVSSCSGRWNSAKTKSKVEIWNFE